MTGYMLRLGLLTILVLGALVVLSALRWPFRWRRALQGTVFLAIACSGYWMVRGGTLGVVFSRVYVVVTGDRLPEAERRRVLDALGPNSEVALVRLHGGAKPAPGYSELSRVRWVKASAVTPMTDAVDVDCASEDWSGPVISVCKNLLRARAWSWGERLFVRPAVVVVPERTGVWQQLRVGRFDLEALTSTITTAPRADLFVVDPPVSSSPGRLQVVFDRASLPATNVVNIPDFVGLRLINTPAPASGKTAQLSAFLDGPLDGDEKEALDGSVRFELKAPLDLSIVPGEPIWSGSFRFGDLAPTFAKGPAGTVLSDRLTPGFHRLTVQLEVPMTREGLEAVEIYSTTRYVWAEESDMVLFFPDKSAPNTTLGSLADPSWEGLTRPQTVTALLDQFLSDAPYKDQRSRLGDILARAAFASPTARYAGRGPLTSILARASGVTDAPHSGQIAPGPGRDEVERIVQAVASAKLLVLVEPSYAQLAYLDGLLSLGARIDDGLNVLVIGPPPAGGPSEPEAGLPDWLPAYARPADLSRDGDPLRVERDARVFVLPDNARPLQFPPSGGGGEYTPLDAQRDVLNKLYAAINGMDPSGHKPTSPAMVIDGKVFGHASPVFGVLNAPGGPRQIEVLPPLSHVVEGLQANIDDFYHTPLAGFGGGLGWLMDTAPSWVPMRLRAVLAEQPGVNLVGAGFRRVEPPHLFPETTVIIFVADLPQLDETRARSVADAPITQHLRISVKPSTEAPVANLSTGTGSDIVRGLALQGVRVLAVRIRLGGTRDALYRSARVSSPSR